MQYQEPPKGTVVHYRHQGYPCALPWKGQDESLFTWKDFCSRYEIVELFTPGTGQAPQEAEPPVGTVFHAIPTEQSDRVWLKYVLIHTPEGWRVFVSGREVPNSCARPSDKSRYFEWKEVYRPNV